MLGGISCNRSARSRRVSNPALQAAINPRTELKNAEEHLTAPLRNTEEENKKKVVLPAKHVTTMTERKVQKTLEDAERNLLQQKLAECKRSPPVGKNRLN